MSTPSEIVSMLDGCPSESLLRDYAAMKAVMERIGEGLSLAELGLPVLSSRASQSEFLHQERTINERAQELIRGALAGLEAEEPILAKRPRWKTHDERFASLVLGPIELAQISRGRATSNWFYTLRFCDAGERSSFSEPTEAAAKAVCEAHARRILS